MIMRAESADILSVMAPSARELLRSYARRRRRLGLARGIAMVFAMMMAWLLAAALLDRTFGLGPRTRLVLLLANGVVGATVFTRSLRRHAATISWGTVARRIELADPSWNQRLCTLTSNSSNTGASRELLVAISGEVEARSTRGARSVAQMLPLRRTLPWVVAAALVLVVVIGLWFTPALHMRTALARQLFPLSGVAGADSVSSGVVIDVEPGSVRVVEGEPLRIRATVARQRDPVRPRTAPSVTLRMAPEVSTAEPQSWAALTMSQHVDDRSVQQEPDRNASDDTTSDDVDGDEQPDPNDVESESSTNPLPSATTRPTTRRSATFSFDFAAVDHPFRYVVTSGDAQAGPFDVRVSRRPAVLEFRIAYDPPAYLRRRAELAVQIVNQDGLIDALRGSEARVDIVSTEPLAAAELNVGGQHVPTTPTSDPKVRRAVIRVEQDAPCAIELTSTDGVTGTGPGTARVRARADAPGAYAPPPTGASSDSRPWGDPRQLDDAPDMYRDALRTYFKALNERAPVEDRK